jgi:hypothetical protein
MPLGLMRVMLEEDAQRSQGYEDTNPIGFN